MFNLQKWFNQNFISTVKKYINLINSSKQKYLKRISFDILKIPLHFPDSSIIMRCVSSHLTANGHNPRWTFTNDGERCITHKINHSDKAEVNVIKRTRKIHPPFEYTSWSFLHISFPSSIFILHKKLNIISFEKKNSHNELDLLPILF